MNAYLAEHRTALSTASACAACAARLCTDGGVTLFDHVGTLVNHTTTGSLAAAAQDLEQSLGEGPMLTAHRTGRLVLLPELGDRISRTQWPLFTSGAIEAGVAAVFAFPLRIGVIRLGTFGLYSAEPRMLSATELRDATSFVDLLIPLLLDGRRAAGASDLPFAAVLDFDDHHHAAVHQATGMVSVQLDVGMDEAFVRLRARAFTESRPLTDVARDVVSRRIRFQPEPRPDQPSAPDRPPGRDD